jgi:hypothetical protein
MASYTATYSSSLVLPQRGRSWTSCGCGSYTPFRIEALLIPCIILNLLPSCRWHELNCSITNFPFCTKIVWCNVISWEQWSMHSLLIVLILAVGGSAEGSKHTSLSDLLCEFLATDPEVRVRFPALPHSLRSSGSGTGSTQPREYNWGATWKKM